MIQFTSEVSAADGEVATDSLSITVVESVAEAAGVDPVDLPPLYTAIDPDALDQLFGKRLVSDTTAVGSVRFVYDGYEVTASAGGDVTVTER